MKKTHIFIFIINFMVLFSVKTYSQENNETIDTTFTYKDKYGIRFGVDFVKVTQSVLDDNYKGFEVMGDYRIYKNYYIAAELGNEDYSYSEPFLVANTSGSYLKAGGNYNFYDNWLGMQNELYAGVRIGFASFSHKLEKYKVYTSDDYFNDDIRVINKNYDNQSSTWVEFQLGIKTEIFNNLFLSAHIQLKNSFTSNELDGFENLYIPGFHRTYQDNSIGVGWGYGISYMIPVSKKERKQKVAN
ncbi:DUF6048 family protein [Mesonia aestuariivivens]|uniref:Autotransporter outer membrane beta-barrel domain-containing protein n=1 Tax=Mesonia aestuariivivens TaxID=2796128 RepID=A0ABS6W1E8_9FLAO|nr:DUF6048 family protein [Mesonia aestuariivivens]MBW2961346.1 hypothetical protein [Mesonia aestuariivivens]